MDRVPESSNKHHMAFLDRTRKTETCWLWTGRISRSGYAQLSWNDGGGRLAHRWSYETYIGAIPPKMTLDHLCRVRHCVNPFHLEPVSIRENTLRGFSIAAVNNLKLECLQGHILADENVYLYKGRRCCKICRRRTMERVRAEERNRLLSEIGFPYVLIEEAVSLAGISSSTISRYIRSGKLLGRKVLRQWRISKSSLEDLLCSA